MATATRYFDCTPASTSALSDWVQVEVTDPDYVAIPQGDGDVSAVLQDGTELPVLVLARTPSRLRVTVALGSPVDAAVPQRIALTVTDEGVAAPTWIDWTCTFPEGPAVGPEIEVMDGLGGSYGLSDQWVHPNILRVDTIQPGDPGYWLRFSTAAARLAGTPDVTHLRIDTPFPEGTERWENPYLLYAGDGLGLDWHPWPGRVDPIEPWPGGTGYNSDPCLAIRSDGSLYCGYRRYAGGVTTLHYRLVQGTCLEDAVVGHRQTPAAAMTVTSPSILPYAGEWLMFYRSDKRWMRMRSTDEGETWTDPTLVVLNADPEAGGTEYQRGYWHGSISGPFAGGWYYLLLLESHWGSGSSGAGMFRAFRTRNPLDTWQAGRSYLIRYGTGSTIAVGGFYQGCVFERSDGSLAICGSGFGVGNVHRVGVTPIDLSDGQTITERQAFQMDIPQNTYGVPVATYHLDGSERGSVVEVDGWDEPGGEEPDDSVWEYEAEVRPSGESEWAGLMPWQERGAGQFTSAATFAAGDYEVRLRARDRKPDPETGEYHIGDWSAPVSVTLAEGGPIILYLTLDDEGTMQFLRQSGVAAVLPVPLRDPLTGAFLDANPLAPGDVMISIDGGEPTTLAADAAAASWPIRNGRVRIPLSAAEVTGREITLRIEDQDGAAYLPAGADVEVLPYDYAEAPQEVETGSDGRVLVSAEPHASGATVAGVDGLSDALSTLATDAAAARAAAEAPATLHADEHTAIRADVQAGLTAQGVTPTLAAALLKASIFGGGQGRWTRAGNIITLRGANDAVVGTLTIAESGGVVTSATSSG